MCNYCDSNLKIFVKEVISDFNWGWGKDRNGNDIKISEKEATHYKLGVFIDRGYLRHVDMEDCDCMEHGQKIKLNYCPFCGVKF